MWGKFKPSVNRELVRGLIVISGAGCSIERCEGQFVAFWLVTCVDLWTSYVISSWKLTESVNRGSNIGEAMDWEKNYRQSVLLKFTGIM